MPTYKPGITGNTNGRQKKIAGTTSGTADTLHTATGVSGEIDEVYAQACNIDTSPIELTLLLGGITNPDDYAVFSIPPRSGYVQVLDGVRFNGGVVIKAFAGTGNKINVKVDVNTITL